MPTITEPLLQHLHTLRLLMPATGLAHVGPAPHGQVLWYQNWAVPMVHWIEADPQRCQQLQQHACEGARQVHQALLGAQAQEQVRWYQLSNQAESGLLPASSLQTLWPNIRTVQEHDMPQTTLDTLLHTQPEAPRINWLCIDCTPAARIAQGASNTLAQVDVVLARVLTQSTAALQGQGASLQELVDVLTPHGFTLLAQNEERNPAYATALFVRDYVAQHRQNLQKQEQLAQTQQVLQADLTKTQTALSEQTLAKEKAQQAHAVQTKALEALQTQLQQAQQQNADLLEKQELQAQTQQELEADLAKTQTALSEQTQAKEQAQQAHAVQAKVQAELETKLDAEIKAKAELHARIVAEAKNKTEAIQKLQQEAKARQELEVQLTVAEADRQEQAHRQQLLQEELIKAEAQIELINDMLLREHGL